MDSRALGLRLSEDQWFAQNTLPFIFRYLKVCDLLRCSEVCTLWHNIARDSSLWRSVTVTLFNYNMNFTKMTKALASLKTVHLRLKIAYKDLRDGQHNLTSCTGLGNMTALRTLEILDCCLSLINILNEEIPPELEVLKARFLCGGIRRQFNRNFISKMSNLSELKLENYHGDQDIEQILTNLGNLKHLYLLGFTNLNFRFSHVSRLPKNATLETLALGKCSKLTKEFHASLKSLTALKELRLDWCVDWNALYCLTCISEMPSLFCLELVDANINEGFTDGIKLCGNLQELTIFPKPHRFNMGIFNTRIFVGVGNLKTTLKKFTLGFHKKYLDYFEKIIGVKNQVPVCRDFHVDKFNPYRELVELDEAKAVLRNLLPNTVVNIVASGAPRGIFS